MKRRIVLACFMCSLFAFSTLSFAQDDDLRGRPEPRGTEPPIGGVQWAKDAARNNAPPFAGGGKSPNLTNHGGPVLGGTVQITPIFWGTSWSTPAGNAKITELNLFYNGLTNSSYAATNTEYVTNGVTPATGFNLNAARTDPTAAPKNGNNTSPILAEVCSQIGLANVTSNGYYPVYVDTKRGGAGFCAWHSAGTCSNGVTVQFAFFFNLDGDAGCDPQDTSGLHSQGVAALANVSGHEISEAVTDPRLNAWYDSSGNENADKCAWTFGVPLVKLTNNTEWKIQGNWSNAAYDSGNGYPNSSGQKGCINTK
jgi:hypothetical protein